VFCDRNAYSQTTEVTDLGYTEQLEPPYPRCLVVAGVVDPGVCDRKAYPQTAELTDVGYIEQFEPPYPDALL
jgi:hypothetical protein